MLKTYPPTQLYPSKLHTSSKTLPALLKMGRWALLLSFPGAFEGKESSNRSQWAVRSKPQSYTCVFHGDVALEMGGGRMCPQIVPPKQHHPSARLHRCFGTSQGASERRGILWRWRGPSGLRWVWRNRRGKTSFLEGQAWASASLVAGVEWGGP